MSNAARHSRLARQTGVTLIELLVATAVGILLLAGVIQIFAGNSQTNRFNDSLARIQENGRFAIEELTREIRMAGFLGCTGQLGLVAVNDTLGATAPASFDPFTGLQGWEANGTGPSEVLTLDFAASPADVTGGGWMTAAGTAPLQSFQAVPGNDVIRIWRGDERGGRIVSTDGNTVTLTESPQFQDGDLVVLSDCQSLDLVRACSVTTGGGETELDMAGCLSGEPRSTLPLVRGTGVGAQANRLVGTVFYIGKRGNDPAAPPALFRQRISGTGALLGAEELAEGVESMQIVYGVDDNGDRQLDEYVTANAVDDWSRVLAVRVSLLLVAPDNNIVDPGQQVTFNGVDQTPGDRRLRQTMTTTISLRNRTL